MPHANRHPRVDLTRTLLESPQAFEFYQAIRLLGPVRIRYRNSLSLSYAAGDIEALRVVSDGREVRDAATAWATVSQRQPDTEVIVTQRFLGLLGNAGALPFNYTEWVLSTRTVRHKNAARGFMDIMSQRPVEQFYAAWRYQNPVLGHETREGSALKRIACAVAGRHTGDEATQTTLPHADVASLSAFLRHRPVSAGYLGMVLSEWLGDRVRIEDFVGAWYALPPTLQSSLGRSQASLGSNAVLGDRSWQRHLRVRLHVGPLNTQRHRAYLADGDATRSLRTLLAAVLGDAFEYEVVPELHRDDVCAVRLGSPEQDGPGPGSLGRNAFLATRASDVHRRDASYLLSP